MSPIKKKSYKLFLRRINSGLNLKFPDHNKQKGFSLMEVIVSVFIIMIIMVSIYSLIVLSLRLANNNKRYVEAIEIANQKMEKIRNMPYSEIGVISGIPSGTIPATEIISREGSFTVNTYIKFFDDPYDGQAGSTTKPDIIITDYKIATIIVSWQNQDNSNSIKVFSKIIPRTEETNAGYGLLKIFVVNSNGLPVPGASVRVINAASSTDVTNITDAEGILYLPAPQAFQAYEVIASSTGYSFDKTYAVTASNPNPTKKHLSVTEGDKTEESFSIDKLSTLNIKTVSSSLLPENWRINSAIASTTSSHPSLALDTSDNIYYTWQKQTATSSQVYVQKFNSSKTKQWINNYLVGNTNFQSKPDIAVSKSGVSYVVWQDNSKAIKLLTRQKEPSHELENKLAKSETIKADFLKLNISDFLIKNSSPEIIYLPKKSEISQKPFFTNPLSVMKANAAGAIVQSKISGDFDGVMTMSATFDSTPVAGNVIVAIGVLRNATTDFNAPTNTSGTFTSAVYSNSAWSLDVGIWYKLTAAAEPKTVTITANKNFLGGKLMILEVSGLDTASPLHLTSANDQTGSSGFIADTGTSAASKNSGFAITASAFADNDFNAPTSVNWSSISTNGWSHKLWDDWNTSNDGSLAVATMDITAVSAQKATLTLTGGGGTSAEERNSVLAIFNTAIPNNLTVTSLNTQVATALSPESNRYIGGTFVLTDAGSGLTITDITITENGSADALADLSNIRLFYDIDSTAPYDCASESFNIATDSNFGLASSSFSASDGFANFHSGTGVSVNSTMTMCVYTILDINNSAAKNSLIDIEIENPSTQIKTSTGTIIPSTPVQISGSTVIQKPAEQNQVHYRFRRDDGDETSATWNNFEDNPSALIYGNDIRLRFMISNSGSFGNPAAQFRLEYAEKVSNCASAVTWNALPTDNSLHWKIKDSSSLTDANSTTNVSSGLTDTATTFIPGQVKDLGNQTSALTINADSFTEIEYSLTQTNNATDATYCFRLTNAGSTADFVYTAYPELNALGDDNVFITAIKNDGTSLWGPKRINEDNGIYQGNPAIALVEKNGSASTTIAWEDDRNGNLDIYARIIDGTGIKSPEFQVTSSSTSENSPVIGIDNNENIFISWVENSASGQNIYLQKFNQSGTSLFSSPVLIAGSSINEYNPSLSIGSDDSIYIAWEEDVLGNKNIRLAKFDNNGNKIWEIPGNLTNSDSDQTEPDVISSSTLVFVTWTDKREGNFDIYSQKYDTSGVAQWTKDLKINISSVISTEGQSQLALTSSIEPYGAWQDGRDSDYNIYSTKFNDPAIPPSAPNIPLLIKGTKKIGENPVILKYNASSTTDALGQMSLNLEWDSSGYTIEIDPSLPSKHIITSEPIMPLGILAGTTNTITIYVD